MALSKIPSAQTKPSYFSDNLHKSYNDNPPGPRYCFPLSDASSIARGPPAASQHTGDDFRSCIQTLMPPQIRCLSRLKSVLVGTVSFRVFKQAFNQSFLWFLLSTKHVREWEVAPHHVEDPMDEQEMLHRHGDGLPAVPAQTDMWICMDECQDCTNTSVNVTQRPLWFVPPSFLMSKALSRVHMSHVFTHDHNLKQLLLSEVQEDSTDLSGWFKH